MIADNLARLNEKIKLASLKVGRQPKEITIVAVSKGVGIEDIKQALKAGIHNIGENRVREAFLKHEELQCLSENLKNIRWHMVGHLQNNKVKDALRFFDLIHSLDSISLASEINKQAIKINKVQDVLVQVNTSGEKNKFGLKPIEVIDFLKEAANFENLRIKGLMTIAPMVDNSEDARFCFRMLKALRDKINDSKTINCEFQILSMGMSNDYEVAIEEGATMIRLGRVIFGEK